MATKPIEMPSPAADLKPDIAYVMVHILNNSGKVDHDDIAVSKSKSQGVCWRSLTNKDAVVEFKQSTGSPFEDPSPIKVPAGGCGYSSKIKGTASNKHYKYTVIGSDGPNDPDVVVEN